MDLNVRFAGTEDARIIVGLVRQGFAPPIVDCIIYGCNGIENYIKAQISQPFCDTRYIVAEEGGQIIGFTEFRFCSAAWMLNYIVVGTPHCGRGISYVLFEKSLGLLVREPVKVRLDVFETNTRAFHLYQKLGFTELSRSGWYDVSHSDRLYDVSRIRIHNVAQCQALYEAYGFSMLDFSVSDQRYSVGIMGAHRLRVTDPHLLSDAEALAFLAACYPDRKIFAILPQTGLCNFGETKLLPLLTSVRMECIFLPGMF